MKMLKNIKLHAKIPAFIIAVLFSLILFIWYRIDPTKIMADNFKLYIHGMDGAPVSAEDSVLTGDFASYGQRYTGSAISTPGSWSGFRGNDSDNVYKESIPLLDTWNEQDPEIIWTVELGEGHAAPAVSEGKVYVLDYDEQRKSDSLRIFSLNSGQEIFRRWYLSPMKRNHGFSRTVPAVSENYAVSIGPTCQVMTVNTESGDFIWHIDMVSKYGTKVPFWYTGQCPLLDNETVILAPAGNVLLTGIDLASGDTIWETPNENNWSMSHSSVMPMTLNNKKMYVYAAIGGVAGISAAGNDRGKILWQTSDWSHSVIAPSPVIFPDGRIFLTAGYGGGSMMIQVYYEQESFNVKTLFNYDPKGGMACEQQTPILYRDHLFGILPKDAGTLRNQFICYNPNEGVTGKIVWSSGKTNQFGLGPYILADGKFYILSDDGVLTIIKASVESYQELDEQKVLPGPDAWGPIAIVNGFMLLRDTKKMICLDMRKKE